MKKRVFALLLVAALCVGLVPASVLAENGTEPAKEELEQEETAEGETDREERPVGDVSGEENAQEEDNSLVGWTDSGEKVSRIEEEIEPKTEVATYGFQIVKKDDLGEVLDGAKFNLYDMYGNIIYFTNVVNDDGTYYNFCQEDTVGATTEIEAGDVYVSGLTKGSYILEEIEAPDGYIGADPITVNIGPEQIDEPDSGIQENTVTPPKTEIAEVTNYAVLDIPVEKVWMDDDVTDHRPESIDVALYANGEETGKVITLSEETDWKGTFSGLRKYDGEEEIEYTVKESSDESLQYYISKIIYNDDGSILIVNQRADFDTDKGDVPEEEKKIPVGRDISGSKTWDDNEDQAEARPDSITVNLYQNDELYDSKMVTEEEDWTWTWEDLPKVDDNGDAYIYTINEDEVDGYIPTYYEESFDIKNTYLSEEEGGSPLNTGSKKGGDVPKTGDMNTFGLWVALCLTGIAGVIAVIRRRKHM